MFLVDAKLNAKRIPQYIQIVINSKLTLCVQINYEARNMSAEN